MSPISSRLARTLVIGLCLLGAITTACGPSNARDRDEHDSSVSGGAGGGRSFRGGGVGAGK
jgi:hypothetical protein